MIDVVYLIGSLPRAGSARHLLQLVRAVDRERFHPSVVCLQKEGSLIADFEVLGVPVYGLGMPTRRHAPSLAALARLVTILRHLKPAIVHTYLFPSNFFGTLAGRLAGVPVIVTSRRSMNEIEPRRHILAYRWTNWAVNRIVAVS
jgi:hypothetical protein